MVSPEPSFASPRNVRTRSRRPICERRNAFAFASPSARELRALGEAKAKAFRRSQIGRRLRVLTLRRGANDGSDETMALAENYVPVKLFEVLPPNQFLTVVAASLDGNQLSGSPLDASVSAVVGAA